MKRVALGVVLAVVALITPPAYSFWGDPNDDVPRFKTVSDACEFFKARAAVEEYEEKPLRDLQIANSYKQLSGETMDDIPQHLIDKAKLAWKRRLAAEVSVLRAMGYSDWKMYSRYNPDGIGDLHRQLGGFDGVVKLSKDKSHPHNKYLDYVEWSWTVRIACNPNDKRYQKFR